MNPNDVIDSYVLDVVRRLPRKDRDGIGFELRGLLGEMLEDRAQTAGTPANDAMALAMLREFGAPADVASRYRTPGLVAIPSEHTRQFALLSLGGIALQWALTLPAAFAAGSLGAWWFSAGLGAFWWPGFLAMMWLAQSWVRTHGPADRAWQPRVLDPDRIHRGAMAAGLVAGVIGAAFMVSLPWLSASLPGPLPQVLAFDPDFLRSRAWPVLPLWLATFVGQATVLSQGRWTARTRRLDLATSLGFVLLMGWWVLDGRILAAPASNAGARGALALVAAILVVHLVVGLLRRPAALRAPVAS